MTLSAELRTRMRALSTRERSFLLLGGAVVLAILLVRGAILPAVEAYHRDRAAIPQRAGVLARYRLAAQGEGRIDERFAELGVRLEGLEEGLLPGDTPAAAGAALQGILKPWMERPYTRLTSMRVLPPAQKGDYAEVAVQMDLQTTTEGLAGLLSEAARCPTVLQVKKLSVSSGFLGPSTADRRENLMVSVTVAGMAGADVETKPAGGKE